MMPWQLEEGLLMTKSNHTPGPWRLKMTDNGEEFSGIIMGGADAARYVCDTGVAFWYNAKLRGVPVADKVIENTLADAHLMAAAPDLLRAALDAEQFIRGFEDDETQPGVRCLSRLIGSQIRAAIAKARGE